MDTIHDRLTTVTYCDQTIQWLLAQLPDAAHSYYPRLASRVFLAFLAEGVLDMIGRTLYASWSSKGENDSLPEKHRLVRRSLGLDNQGEEYQKFRRLFTDLKVLRDHLAHPKIIEEVVPYHRDDMGRGILGAVGWEKQMKSEDEALLYQDLRGYLQYLLDRTHDVLIVAKQDDTYSKKYPHLCGSDLIALRLKYLLETG